METGYSPHPKQILIHESLHPPYGGRIVMCIAGRRSGKTVCAINQIIKHAIEHPYSKIWYVAHTKEQAYDVAWPMMIEGWTDKEGKIHSPYLPSSVIKKTRLDKHMIWLHNGSKIQFKGIQDELFILGSGLDFVVLDEFPAIPWSAWYDTIRPMLLDRNADALFIGTVPDPWVHTITPEFIEMYEEYLFNPTEIKMSFNFTSKDNPYINHDKIDDDIKDLERKGRIADAKRLYQGTYTRGTGKIWPHFDLGKHTCDPIEIPKSWMRLMALDPHPQRPYVAVWCALDYNRPPHYWFYREHEFKGPSDGRTLTVPETASMILQTENLYDETVARRYIDPTYAKIQHKTLLAKQQSVQEMLRDCGLYFIEANRDFNFFYNQFGDMLADDPPSVHIFRTLPNLTRQINNAIWDTYASSRQRAERGAKDKPKKKDDDYRDCAKYIINANIKPPDWRKINAFKENLHQKWEEKRML